jgi:hypothetical protein
LFLYQHFLKAPPSVESGSSLQRPRAQPLSSQKVRANTLYYDEPWVEHFSCPNRVWRTSYQQ